MTNFRYELSKLIELPLGMDDITHGTWQIRMADKIIDFYRNRQDHDLIPKVKSDKAAALEKIKEATERICKNLTHTRLGIAHSRKLIRFDCNHIDLIAEAALQEPDDSELATDLYEALKAMLNDLKNRIDNIGKIDGYKEDEGYVFPWGNSVMHKIDDAMEKYELKHKGVKP